MAESAASRRARVKLQLRDKHGRWIEMGGGAKWTDNKTGQAKAGTIVGFDGNFVLVAQKPANATAQPAPMRIPVSMIDTYAIKGNLDPYYKKQIDAYLNNLKGKQKEEYDARTEAVAKGKKAIIDGKEAPQEYVEIYDKDDDTDGVMDEIDFSEFKASLQRRYIQTSDGKRWFRTKANTIYPLSEDDEVLDPTKGQKMAKFEESYGDTKIGDFGKAPVKKRSDAMAELIKGMDNEDQIIDGNGHTWTKLGRDLIREDNDLINYNPLFFKKNAQDNKIVKAKTDETPTEKAPEADTAPEKAPEAQTPEWPDNAPEAGKYDLDGDTFIPADKDPKGNFVYLDGAGNPLKVGQDDSTQNQSVEGIGYISDSAPIIGTNKSTEGKVTGHSVIVVDKDGKKKKAYIYKTSPVFKGNMGVYAFDPEKGATKHVAETGLAENLNDVNNLGDVPTGTIYSNGKLQFKKGSATWQKRSHFEGDKWSTWKTANSTTVANAAQNANNDGNPLMLEGAEKPKAEVHKPTPSSTPTNELPEWEKALLDEPYTPNGTSDDIQKLEDWEIELLNTYKKEQEDAGELEAPKTIGANQSLKNGIVFTPVSDLNVGDEIYPINYGGQYPAKTPYAHSQAKLDDVDDDQVNLSTDLAPIAIEAVKTGKYAVVTLPDGDKGYLGWKTLAAKTSDNGENSNKEQQDNTDAAKEETNKLYAQFVKEISGASSEDLPGIADKVRTEMIIPLQTFEDSPIEYDAYHREKGNDLLDDLRDRLVESGTSQEAAEFFVNMKRSGLRNPRHLSATETLTALSDEDKFAEFMKGFGKITKYRKDRHAFQGKSSKEFIGSDQVEDAKIYYNLERSRKVLEAALNTNPTGIVSDVELDAPEPVDMTPIDVTSWTKVSGAQGSNPGGIYEDKEGNRWYVKQSQTDDHARNEVLADMLYLETGVDAAGLRLADVGGGKLGTASPMIDGAKNDLSTKIKNNAYLAKLREGFAVDAWLANWDVLGLGLDNVVTDEQGLPVRIDPGGAMKYRAQGSLKADLNPAFWGEEVLDWNSLRDPKVGTAAKAFAGISDEEMKESAKRVMGISPERINEMVDALNFPQAEADELKSILKARREDIISKADLESEIETAPQGVIDTANAKIGSTYSSQNGFIVMSKGFDGQWHEFHGGSYQGTLTEANVQGMSEDEDYTKVADIAIKSTHLNEVPKNSVIKKSPEDDSILIHKTATGAYMLQKKGDAPVQLDKWGVLNEMNVASKDDLYHSYMPMAPLEGFSKEFIAGFLPGDDGFPVKDIDYKSDYVTPKAPITDLDYQYIAQYVDHSGGVNSALRDMIPVAEYMPTVAQLDQLMDKSVLNQDVKVFRGFELTHAQIEALRNSGGYVDLGFMSTSHSEDIAENFAGTGQNTPSVILELDLPAGFHAHAVDYSQGDDSYSSEEEVILPRGTKFAITGEEDFTPKYGSGGEGVKFTLTPILNEDNFEGAKNGTTEESGDGTDTTESTDSGSKVSTEPDEGADDAPIESTDGEGTGEVEQTEEPVPATEEVTYPDKGKVAVGEDGEEFKVNMKVMHPKYGTATIMTILPSTNSAKIITPEGNSYTVGAKKIKKLSADAPIEAIAVEGTEVGDKGIDAETGKMYLLGKEKGKLFTGTKVSYTKKGETFTGTVEALYPSSQQAKVDWEEGSDQAAVKKVSQLLSLDEDQNKGTVEKTLDVVEDIATPEAEKAPEAPKVDSYDANFFEEVENGSRFTYLDTSYTRASLDKGWVATAPNTDPYFVSSDDLADMSIPKDDWAVEQITPNYTFADLNGFDKGDKIISKLYGVTAEKDEDGSWWVKELSTFYDADELLSDMPDDSWEYVEAPIENNLSQEELDNLPTWSQLSNDNMSLSKDKDGVWTDDETGVEYTSEDLLIEHPSNTWWAAEAVISPDDYDLLGIGGVDDYTIGSVISATDSATEYPSEFIKLADQEWLPYKDDKPQGITPVLGNTFDDNYTSLVQMGDGKFPFTENTIESNSDPISKADLTLEKIQEMPIGTKLKESQGTVAYYQKVADNTWTTKFPYKDGKNGTDELMLKAAYGFNIVEIPEQTSDAIEAGAVMSKELLDTAPIGAIFKKSTNAIYEAFFEKVGDGTWDFYSSVGTKMSFDEADMETFVDGTMQTTPYISATHDDPDVEKAILGYNGKVDASEQYGATATDENTEVDYSEYPDSLGDFTEEQLKSMPLGTKFMGSEEMKGAFYEKIDDSGWQYTNTKGNVTSIKTDNKLSQYELDDFHLDKAISNDAISTDDVISAQGAYSDFPDTLQKYPMDKLKALPIGATFNGVDDLEGGTFTKTADGQWLYKHPIHDGKSHPTYTNSVMHDFNFPGVVLDKSTLGTLPESAPVDHPKTLDDLTTEQVKALPIGTVAKSSAGSTKYTKVAENKWQYNSHNIYNEDYEFAGISLGYDIVLPGDESKSAASGKYIEKGLVNFDSDTLGDVPVGAYLLDPNGDDGWVKVGHDKWVPFTDNDPSSPAGVNYDDEDLSLDLEDTEGWSYFELDPNTAEEKSYTAPDNMGDATLEEVQGVPVGSYFLNGEGNGYVKTAENKWMYFTGNSPSGYAYPDAGGASDSDIAGAGSYWNESKFHAPDGSSTPVAPEKSYKVPEDMSGLSLEEINALPAGSYFQDEDGTSGYVKTEDGKWHGFSENPSDYTNFEHLPEALENLNAGTFAKYKFHDVDGSVAPKKSAESSGDPKNLVGLSEETLDSLPEGGYFQDKNDTDGYVKMADGTWHVFYNSDPENAEHNGAYSNAQMANKAGYMSNYEYHAPEVEEYDGPEPEKELVQGTPLSDLTPENIAEAKIGTEVVFSANGKVKGSYKKVGPNKWKYTPEGAEKPSPTTITDEAMSMGIKGIPNAAFTVKPDEVPEDSDVAVPEEDVNEYYQDTVWWKGQAQIANTWDGLESGSVVKFNSPNASYSPTNVYYVKEEDGSWTKYKNNMSKLSSKKNVSANDAYWETTGSYGSMTISKPKSNEGVVTGSGEIAYAGDTVKHMGDTYTVAKVLKTGVNLVDADGNKVKAKAKDLTVDPDHGQYKGHNPDAGSSKPAVDYSNPIEQVYKAEQDKKKAEQFLQNFAGASGDEYMAQGLGVKAIEPDLGNGLTVQAKKPADPSNPLHGTPEPVMPKDSSNYPSFQAPDENYENWDSAAWLKKVEERYLSNPNKAKDKVQESNNWGTIQSVLNGETGAPLDKLLNSQYITQEMYDEAKKGIEAHEASLAAQKAEHAKKIKAAKAEYEAKKKEDLAEYNAKLEQYKKDYEAWSEANPNPNAIDLPKLPGTSKDEFLGGDADWDKAPTGTFSANSILDAVKTDAASAKKGLSFAMDSDKIEDFDVDVKRIIDQDGQQKLEYNFKVTAAFGDVLKSTFIGWGADKTGGMAIMEKATDKTTGLLKNKGYSNQMSFSDGNRYTAKVDDASVVLQKSDSSSAQGNLNVNTIDNSVRMTLPLGSTTEDFQKVVEKMGISAKPTRQGDIRVLAENKLLKMFAPDKSAKDNTNFTGDERKKALAAIEKQFGVTIDNVLFTQDSNGKVRLHLDKDTTKKLNKDYGYTHFYHSFHSNDEAILNMITGANPGLSSTYHRWTNGIGGTGASSHTDLSYGSGDYVYTSAKTGDLHTHNGIYIRPEAILSRLDFWANEGDNYGKKSSNSSTPHQLMKSLAPHGAPYEVLPKDNIALKDIMYISTNKAERDAVIKKAKERGITHVNGMPIESFVVSPGHDNVPDITEWSGVEGEQVPTQPDLPTGGAEAGGEAGGEGSAPAAGGAPAV